MSFSAETKNQLARILPGRRCCRQTELLALLRSGAVSRRNAEHTGQKVLLQFGTEHAAVARKVVALLRQESSLAVQVGVCRGGRVRKRGRYRVLLGGERELLRTLRRWDRAGDPRPGGRPDGGLFRCGGCWRAYLRGAFLGAGSISSPGGEYHLEVQVRDGEGARSLLEGMERSGLSGRTGRRRGRVFVYLKGSEEIATFLSTVGAHQQRLAFENVRILKDLRSQVNRSVNCETANLSRVVNAGVRQCEAIDRLDRDGSLERLAPALREVARLRREFPSASLQELGEMMDPPCSKSAVNHRLRKLEWLADKRQ